MIRDEYSPYKIVHHLDKIEALRRGEQTPPIHIHLIPANRCNHNRLFCANRFRAPKEQRPQERESR